MYILSAFAAITLLGGSFASFNTPNCQQGTSIVHLFNWKWTDVATECERFLGPRGFCGVQVSPPHEHIIAAGRQWWERYQPVSYILESRSGNEAQFTDMISRCDAAGVNIYVDVLFNHMAGSTYAGTGSAGSEYDAGAGHFPAVPYGSGDFNPCTGVCSDNWCDINNYGDPVEVRNCRMSGLMDLALGKTYVRETVQNYLNYLTSLGVSGFRVDAAKHMWPGDMEAIFNGLNGSPFIYNEVIDLGFEPVKATEYTHLGRVTEFKYSQRIGFNFRGKDKLAYMENFGEAWGFLPDGDSFVFVDNHDNQRGHGAGGADILNYKTSRLYKLANAYMLAWPYGFTRVMSSYEFTDGEHGPPANGDGSIKDVTINADGTCGNGWVCEHRWRQIFNMVEFRNVASGTGVDYWWDNGNNQIAFARGNKAFIAINNDNYDLSLNNYYIGLPDGTYCDVISGGLENGACTGYQVTVSGGTLSLYVSSSEADPMFAFHECSKIGSSCGNGGSGTTPQPGTTPEPGPTEPPPEGYERTVVFMHTETNPGQFVFLKGGKVNGCTEGDCPVTIEHNSLGADEHYDSYNAWAVGDDLLDWTSGAEEGQGTYEGATAEGSPTAWTTNSAASDGYQPLNQYGEHYWMMDVSMNCDDTDNGWFDLKAYMDGWEPDVSQTVCTGTSGGSAPNPINNHVAMCGKVNVFEWGTGSCIIDDFS